jgi:hypothetical protein
VFSFGFTDEQVSEKEALAAGFLSGINHNVRSSSPAVGFYFLIRLPAA